MEKQNDKLAFVAQRSWLPLWGSCHGTAVTERALSAPVGGTSPIGRGKTLPDKHQFTGLKHLPAYLSPGVHRVEAEPAREEWK